MNTLQLITLIIGVLYIAFWGGLACLIIYLLLLTIKALKKYINSKEVREEKKEIQKSLGEVLKENRVRCKMTQEFVSESLGVSRQAVSKWENGSSDPSTSNLISLAKLYGVASEDLIKAIDTSSEKEN